jgi:NADH-quinone oxidoreductase subunit M
MGIPGFSGFAAEITVLIGTWRAYPTAVWITGIGMVLVAAFTLRGLTKSFFGDRAPADRAPSEPHTFAPITVAEKWGAGLLMFSTLAVGLYPKLLMDRIQPAIEAMRWLPR